MDSILGLKRSPQEGYGNPLQYSCLEDPMDRGAWQAIVHGVMKNQTQLSDWACTHDLKGAHSATCTFYSCSPPLSTWLYYWKWFSHFGGITRDKEGLGKRQKHPVFLLASQNSYRSPRLLTSRLLLLLYITCVRAKLLQSCLTLCNCMDCSPPGSCGHEILQAKVLRWVSCALLQGILQTQGSSPSLLCLWLDIWVLYH